MSVAGEAHACFYCHEPGHLISNCPSLKKKIQSKKQDPSAVVLIQPGCDEKKPGTQPTVFQELDDDFKPFAPKGLCPCLE